MFNHDKTNTFSDLPMCERGLKAWDMQHKNSITISRPTYLQFPEHYSSLLRPGPHLQNLRPASIKPPPARRHHTPLRHLEQQPPDVLDDGPEAVYP